jgi:hypothetical protein
VTFLGPPVGWLGGEATQPVVYLDDQRSLALWEALRSNSAAAYARLHPGDSLGAMPP